MTIGCGSCVFVSKLINRKLATKTNRNDEMKILTEAKVTTIDNYIWNVLADGLISQYEFILIMDEVENVYWNERTGMYKTPDK